MPLTADIDVNRAVTSAPRRLLSLLASFAVALTFFRFSAAHLEAERAAGADER